MSLIALVTIAEHLFPLMSIARLVFSLTLGCLSSHALDNEYNRATKESKSTKGMA